VLLSAVFSIARSENGWMTSDIFEYWANVYIPEFAEKKAEKILVLKSG